MVSANFGDADIVTGLDIVSGFPVDGALVASAGRMKEVHNVIIEMNCSAGGCHNALTALGGQLPYLNMTSITVSGDVNRAIYYRLAFSPSVAVLEDVMIRSSDPSYSPGGITVHSQHDLTVLRADIEVKGTGISSGSQSTVSVLDSNIVTTCDLCPALEAYYGRFQKVHNNILETQGDDAPAVYLEETGNILEMTDNILVRNGNLATAAPAIRFQGGKNNFVDTLNVSGNIICYKEGSNADWSAYLVEDTTPISTTTTPYDGGTNYGYTTFPWGDSTHSGTNPGYNLQAQWGGPCP